MLHGCSQALPSALSVHTKILMNHNGIGFLHSLCLARTQLGTLRLSVFASLSGFIELFIHSGSRLRDERKSRDLLGEVSRTVSTFSAVFQTTIVKLSSALLRNSSVDLKGRIVILLRFTENLGHRTFITPLGSNPLPKEPWREELRPGNWVPQIFERKRN